MQEIDQIIDTRISVEWLILADAAEVTGGKLYLLGGGWDRLTVNSQPAKRSFAVALAFRVPWHETNRQHVFQIEMADADGGSALTVQGQFEVGPAGRDTTGTTPAHPASRECGCHFRETWYVCDHGAGELRKGAFDSVQRRSRSGSCSIVSLRFIV